MPYRDAAYEMGKVICVKVTPVSPCKDLVLIEDWIFVK